MLACMHTHSCISVCKCFHTSKSMQYASRVLNKLVATRATQLTSWWPICFVSESRFCSYLREYLFNHYHPLHKNTTWNSLHIGANRRSLDQIEDFWWFFVHCKFLTRIFTAASGHLTHKMLLKWWPVSLFSICMTKIVPDSYVLHAQMLTRCIFQSDSPMLLVNNAARRCFQSK